jgi:hypothetical protein
VALGHRSALPRLRRPAAGSRYLNGILILGRTCSAGDVVAIADPGTVEEVAWGTVVRDADGVVHRCRTAILVA